MALYLVIHTPDPEQENDDAVRPPTRLRELAEAMTSGYPLTRWLQTWSGEIGDDRIFSLWDAVDAQAIQDTMAEYGFLDHMVATPVRVRAWGPGDVLDA